MGRCPYDQHAPHSADGEAAWMAGLGCVKEGGVDVTAAIAGAERLGCDPAAAPELVMAVNAGLWAGYRKRKDGEEAERERDDP